ncbi:PIG-L family deacetylase, partial [Dermatophilus congolensis]
MNTTPTFHHTDPGTPEHTWLQDPRWDHTPTLNTTTLFNNHTHLLVASAHPDDETLGAGLLIQEAHRAGLHITILVATNGEASHPHSPTWTANMLSTTRHNELHEAINTLAPGATITHLNLPDSKLANHHNHLTHTLTTTTNKHTILLAPYPKDGHTDHDTLGAAAHTAATTTGALLMHYPLWLWHWGTPNDLPWNNTITLPATPHTLTTKKTALAKHRTQTQPLSPLTGDEPIITPNVTT